MKPKVLMVGLVLGLIGGALVFYSPFRRVGAQSATSLVPLSSAPAKVPMAPAMPQSVTAGLWRVDHNFMASLHIKNLMAANPIQVTPVLYLADGTEYDLAPVNLAPTAVADISINQALGQAPASVASHLSTYGSAALEYMYPAPGMVTGQLMMVDAPRSLVFTNGFAMMAAMGNAMPHAQTQEGVWWRHDPGVGGFVSLTNTTAGSVDVGVQVLGRTG